MGASLKGKTNPMYTHGACVNGKLTRTYKSWSSMLERCTCPTHVSYPNYGGRGIRVCKAWRNDYAAFLADMGPRPSGYTLERVDNDGDYEPGNCIWTPRGQQSENRTTTRFITIGNRRQSISRWCQETGVGMSTAFWRINNGWDPIRAVTTPARPLRRKNL